MTQTNDLDPFRCTSAAYDLVYRRLYDSLPDCRDCPCMALELALFGW